MKRLTIKILALCGAAAAFTTVEGGFLNTNPRAPRSRNTMATEPYMKTQVQAQLRMEVGGDTEQVHFIRDNNDPYVVTKAYILKHADPYEIRTFILRAVQSNRVTPDNTTVECIKYNDGTGIIVVSAEEYRFKPLKSGMNIDQIVAALDKPKLASSSGQTTFLYFPKYWAARDMAQLIINVGANVFGDDTELQFGRDSIQYDTGLNALLMYMPRYSQKNIEKVMKLYDCPTYEVEVTYKLYEIYAENDAKIGVDFQAWKNNAGADLFSVGGRYRDGWSATWSGGADKSGSSKTSFMNFNPKWNTRYLDFLASKGNGKILTQGKLLVMTNTTGTVEVKNNIFNIEQGEKIPDKGVITGAMGLRGNFVTSGTAAAAGNVDSYMMEAYDAGGTHIDFAAAFSGSFTVTRIITGKVTSYALRIASGSGGSLEKDGRNLGLETTALAFTMYTCVEHRNDAGVVTHYTWDEVDNWSNQIDLSIQKGYKVKVEPAKSDYGFSMSISPEVNENSSIISLNMTNDSLIGWKSDGSPRIARDTEYKTKIMVDNNVKKFVVGGMEKRSLVTTVSGVPFLKDLPFLGYLFSTENPTTKRSRLVMVLECKMQNPDSRVSKEIMTEINSVNAKIGVGGEHLPLATQQLFLGKGSK